MIPSSGILLEAGWSSSSVMSLKRSLILGPILFNIFMTDTGKWDLVHIQQVQGRHQAEQCSLLT